MTTANVPLHGLMTETDYDRLKHLVGSPRYRSTQTRSLGALIDGLDRDKIVPPRRVPKGVVTMHSTVRVREMGSKDSHDHTLVYPEEANITEGKISVLAPMGSALLGARAGQVVGFESPGGWRRLKVVKVLYQPEAAGDLHL